jgi:hypothetical protein
MEVARIKESLAKLNKSMSDYEQQMPGHPKFVAPATPTKRSHASSTATSSTNDSQRDTMPAERIKEWNTNNQCDASRYSSLPMESGA